MRKMFGHTVRCSFGRKFSELFPINYSHQPSFIPKFLSELILVWDFVQSLRENIKNVQLFERFDGWKCFMAIIWPCEVNWLFRVRSLFGKTIARIFGSSRTLPKTNRTRTARKVFGSCPPLMYSLSKEQRSIKLCLVLFFCFGEFHFMNFFLVQSKVSSKLPKITLSIM